MSSDGSEASELESHDGSDLSGGGGMGGGGGGGGGGRSGRSPGGGDILSMASGTGSFDEGKGDKPQGKDSILEHVTRNTIIRAIWHSKMRNGASLGAAGDTVYQHMTLSELVAERVHMRRMNFMDAVRIIDRRIEMLRTAQREERERMENQLIETRLKGLERQQAARIRALEERQERERQDLFQKFASNEAHLVKKHNKAYQKLVEETANRATGGIVQADEAQKYLSRQNKSASYRTRKPHFDVIRFRKNAQRLREMGRRDEALQFESKAAAMDEEHEMRWREKVAASITSSEWGAAKSKLEQLVEQQSTEMRRMQLEQDSKLAWLEQKHGVQKNTFMNTLTAERTKAITMCKKQAKRRQEADAAEALKESQKQRRIEGRSGGLNNLSNNLMRDAKLTDEEAVADIDWRPPEFSGMSNSAPMVENDANKRQEGGAKIVNSALSMLREQLGETQGGSAPPRPAFATSAGGGGGAVFRRSIREDSEEEEDEEAPPHSQFNRGRRSPPPPAHDERGEGTPAASPPLLRPRLQHHVPLGEHEENQRLPPISGATVRFDDPPASPPPPRSPAPPPQRPTPPSSRPPDRRFAGQSPKAAQATMPKPTRSDGDAEGAGEAGGVVYKDTGEPSRVEPSPKRPAAPPPRGPGRPVSARGQGGVRAPSSSSSSSGGGARPPTTSDMWSAASEQMVALHWLADPAAALLDLLSSPGTRSMVLATFHHLGVDEMLGLFLELRVLTEDDVQGQGSKRLQRVCGMLLQSAVVDVSDPEGQLDDLDGGSHELALLAKLRKSGAHAEQMLSLVYLPVLMGDESWRAQLLERIPRLPNLGDSFADVLGSVCEGLPVPALVLNVGGGAVTVACANAAAAALMGDSALAGKGVDWLVESGLLSPDDGGDSPGGVVARSLQRFVAGEDAAIPFTDATTVQDGRGTVHRRAALRQPGGSTVDAVHSWTQVCNADGVPVHVVAVLMPVNQGQDSAGGGDIASEILRAASTVLSLPHSEGDNGATWAESIGYFNEVVAVLTDLRKPLPAGVLPWVGETELAQLCAIHATLVAAPKLDPHIPAHQFVALEWMANPVETLKRLLRVPGVAKVTKDFLRLLGAAPMLQLVLDVQDLPARMPSDEGAQALARLCRGRPVGAETSAQQMFEVAEAEAAEALRLLALVYFPILLSNQAWCQNLVHALGAAKDAPETKRMAEAAKAEAWTDAFVNAVEGRREAVALFHVPPPEEGAGTGDAVAVPEPVLLYRNSASQRLCPAEDEQALRGMHVSRFFEMTGCPDAVPVPHRRCLHRPGFCQQQHRRVTLRAGSDVAFVWLPVNATDDGRAPVLGVAVMMELPANISGMQEAVFETAALLALLPRSVTAAEALPPAECMTTVGQSAGLFSTVLRALVDMVLPPFVPQNPLPADWEQRRQLLDTSGGGARPDASAHPGAGLPDAEAGAEAGLVVGAYVRGRATGMVPGAWSFAPDTASGETSLMVDLAASARAFAGAAPLLRLQPAQQPPPAVQMVLCEEFLPLAWLSEPDPAVRFLLQSDLGTNLLRDFLSRCPLDCDAPALVDKANARARHGGAKALARLAGHYLPRFLGDANMQQLLGELRPEADFGDFRLSTGVDTSDAWASTFINLAPALPVTSILLDLTLDLAGPEGAPTEKALMFMHVEREVDEVRERLGMPNEVILLSKLLATPRCAPSVDVLSGTTMQHQAVEILSPGSSQVNAGMVVSWVPIAGSVGTRPRFVAGFLSLTSQQPSDLRTSLHGQAGVVQLLPKHVSSSRLGRPRSAMRTGTLDDTLDVLVEASKWPVALFVAEAAVPPLSFQAAATPPPEVHLALCEEFLPLAWLSKPDGALDFVLRTDAARGLLQRFLERAQVGDLLASVPDPAGGGGGSVPSETADALDALASFYLPRFLGDDATSGLLAGCRPVPLDPAASPPKLPADVDTSDAWAAAFINLAPQLPVTSLLVDLSLQPGGELVDRSAQPQPPAESTLMFTHADPSLAEAWGRLGFPNELALLRRVLTVEGCRPTPAVLAGKGVHHRSVLMHAFDERAGNAGMTISWVPVAGASDGQVRFVAGFISLTSRLADLATSLTAQAGIVHLLPKHVAGRMADADHARFKAMTGSLDNVLELLMAASQYPVRVHADPATAGA